MSGTCYPDRLISSLPSAYLYAANKPSEATIGKRRSYSATVSYLTPPAENAKDSIWTHLAKQGDVWEDDDVDDDERFSCKRFVKIFA